jgi:hypothetical protein
VRQPPEHLPVVGRDDDGRARGLQPLQQIVDQCHRQVVGGLIEQQHVRLLPEHAGEVLPPQLPGRAVIVRVLVRLRRVLLAQPCDANRAVGADGALVG